MKSKSEFRLNNPFKSFTPLEWTIWIISLSILIITFLISSQSDYIVMAATLIGVTGLIFLAKGNFFGHICTICFSILYGISSISFHYYGEFITYVFMTLPMAVISLITWIKNPYKDTDEVAIGSMNKFKFTLLIFLSCGVTLIFFFILRAFNTNNLIFSTISIATSFLAVALTAFRSPYYAIAYMANDIVLITLWSLASASNPKYIPYIISFSIFLFQDFYSYVSWQKMKKRQEAR